MITRAQKIRLGVFVIIALVILLGLLAAVVGSFLWENRDRYDVRYDISVSGLEIGAPVKYNGVRVGRVERIRIDPKEVSRTIVAISLEAGTPLKENTRAILNVQGITGLKFIELVGGTSDAATLSPGSQILTGTSVVDKLTGQAETISIKAELLFNQLLSLTGDENRSLLNNVLERASTLMGSLEQLISKNTDVTAALLKNLSLASERLVGTLDEIRRTIQDTREAVNQIARASTAVLDARQVGAVLDEAKGALHDVRQRVGTGEMGRVSSLLAQLLGRTDNLVEKLDLMVARSREDLQASLRFLAEASENMRDFSRLIREDPSRLLRTQERRERVLP